MIEEKTDKIISIISFLVILIAAVLLVIYKYYPEYKSSIGSSDGYVNIDSYKEIVNISMQSGPEFILVTNEEDKISSILFINQDALCLYNRNIENQELDDSIDGIIKILYNSNYLTNEEIAITSYNSTNKLRKDLISKIKKDYSDIPITEDIKTLTINEQKKLLQEKENESRRNIKKLKEAELIESNSSNLTEEVAYVYADNICQKLSSYASRITNQEKNSPNYPIQLISGEDDKNIYPSAKSWYYIVNSEVLGYINFKSDKYDYSYCCQNKIVIRGICHE